MIVTWARLSPITNGELNGDWHGPIISPANNGCWPPFSSPIDGCNVTPDPLQSDHCAEKLRALGDPIRIKIIDALRVCPLNVTELADCLESEVVTISHHLGVLRHADLLDRKKQGRFVVYSIREGVFKPTKSARITEHIDLGCCRLEIPR